MRILLAAVVAGALAGCGLSAPSATGPRRKTPVRSSAQKGPAGPSPAQKQAEAAAQQKAYDRGLDLYGKEEYNGARKAFAEAVRLNPASSLGKKAKENLDKVENILRSLKEIEGQ